MSGPVLQVVTNMQREAVYLRVLVVSAAFRETVLVIFRGALDSIWILISHSHVLQLLKLIWRKFNWKSHVLYKQNAKLNILLSI